MLRVIKHGAYVVFWPFSRLVGRRPHHFGLEMNGRLWSVGSAVVGDDLPKISAIFHWLFKMPASRRLVLKGRVAY